jgi:hypothetical protein
MEDGVSLMWASDESRAIAAPAPLLVGITARR